MFLYYDSKLILSLQFCDSRKNPSLSILVSNGYTITGNALSESDSDVIMIFTSSGKFFVSSLNSPSVRLSIVTGMVFSFCCFLCFGTAEEI